MTTKTKSSTAERPGAAAKSRRAMARTPAVDARTPPGEEAVREEKVAAASVPSGRVESGRVESGRVESRGVESGRVDSAGARPASGPEPVAAKAGADAATQAGLALVSGMQELQLALMGLAQAQVEDTIAAATALAGARSVHEVVDIQMRTWRNGFDKLTASGERLSEAARRMAEGAAVPLRYARDLGLGR